MHFKAILAVFSDFFYSMYIGTFKLLAFKFGQINGILERFYSQLYHETKT